MLLSSCAIEPIEQEMKDTPEQKPVAISVESSGTAVSSQADEPYKAKELQTENATPTAATEPNTASSSVPEPEEVRHTVTSPASDKIKPNEDDEKAKKIVTELTMFDAATAALQEPIRDLKYNPRKLIAAIKRFNKEVTPAKTILDLNKAYGKAFGADISAVFALGRMDGDKWDELFKTGKMSTDSKILQAFVDSARQFLSKTTSQECIKSDKGAIRPTPECKRLAESCKDTFGSADGDLYLEEATDEPAIERKPVTDAQELAVLLKLDKQYPSESAARWYLERKYYFCKAIALMGMTFTPKAVARTPDLDPEWAKPALLLDAESYLKQCKDTELEKHQKLLEDILESRPKAYPFSFWLQTVKSSIESCRDHAASICQHVGLIRGTMFVSYPTVECKVRRVTRTDIQNDLERFKLNGMTEADRLDHATLLDVLDACADAHEKGYLWVFGEASVDEAHCQANQNEYSHVPQPSPFSTSCCKVCTIGKACGNSCISFDKMCHRPVGCACDG